MEKFALTIFSLKFNTKIEIGYTEQSSQVIFDFISIFNVRVNNKNQSLDLDYKQQYTEELKDRINSYVSAYKKNSPQVQQINKYFKKLNNNEWFFVLPPTEFNAKEKLYLETELNGLNNCKAEASEKEILRVFGCILDNYEIITFDLNKDKKIKIGENNKSKRVCRFCNESKPDVKFRNEAHAVSEALGNKKLILNEECDDCNTFFDENIERDFINYHDLSRTIFGIKNKDNNYPKMKGNDFEVFKDKDNSNLSIAIVQNGEKGTANKPPQNIVFKTGNKIKIQNLYKALCKFSLSVIDTKYIQNFEDTISWLKNKKQIDKLPKIALLNSSKIFTKTPIIALYLRNNSNKSLPYLIGEFRFTYYMYIFIVPFSNQDNRTFLNDNEYQDFLECFKQVTNVGEFNYLDFSQNIERKLEYIVNFEQRKN